jgi:hypothetical protein
MTVVPHGTETDAGLKAKFRMVTATGGGGTGVVGATVVVVGGIVVAVVVAVVTVVWVVVTTGVAGGDVVAGVAGVVTGAGPDGAAHPARRTASRTAIPTKGYRSFEVRVLIELPHVMSPLQGYKHNPHGIRV